MDFQKKHTNDGSNILKIKKLSKNATIPKRATSESVGYDLYSANSKTVPPKDKILIHTDIALKIPPGHYGRIAPRSSLALKNFIDIGAGVIDPDYRGNVGVVIFNHSNVPFEIKIGDRIAQLILEKCSIPDIKCVENLNSTERNGGFGSTGYN